MQRFAKFKKILRRGFRATLNFRKFKLALNPLRRIKCYIALKSGFVKRFCKAWVRLVLRNQRFLLTPKGKVSLKVISLSIQTTIDLYLFRAQFLFKREKKIFLTIDERWVFNFLIRLINYTDTQDRQHQNTFRLFRFAWFRFVSQATVTPSDAFTLRLHTN